MRKKIAALAVAGGALMALAVPVSSAQAAASGQCDTWSDGNTYGAGHCNFPPGNYMVYATARCKDGTTLTGPDVPISSMSYVYCAGHGGLLSGGVYFTYKA